MIRLLKGMFIDMHNRVDAMVYHLAAQTMDTPGASSFKKTTLWELLKLKDKLSKILDDGTLDNDLFASNVAITYSHLEEEYREIEQYLFQPISRYSVKAEGYFEVVIRSIYEQINFAQEPPYVSTMSNADAYFRAYPKFKMIMLPQGEEKHLLNLGDLYHEIGHLIYRQYEDYLVRDFEKVVTEYYRALAQRSGKKHRELKMVLPKMRRAWIDCWTEELACDGMATYTVGPAYGWSHLKICVLSGKQHGFFGLPAAHQDHPPDEMRMRVILRMLQLIGCSAEAAAITAIWYELVRATPGMKAAGYEELFTDPMVETLANNVFQGCCDIVLQSYPQQKTNHTLPMSRTINEAWDKILHEPETFTQWTDEQITNIGTRI